MTNLPNAVNCDRCRKPTMDWIKDRWLAVVGRVWIGTIKGVDHESNTGHYCSWKCLAGPTAEELDRIASEARARRDSEIAAEKAKFDAGAPLPVAPAQIEGPESPRPE